MTGDYQKVTEDEARSLIDRHGLDGHGSQMMGGVFYYRPGSPTGYPYVQVARIIPSGYPGEDPEHWQARKELLSQLKDGA